MMIVVNLGDLHRQFLEILVLLMR